MASVHELLRSNAELKRIFQKSRRSRHRITSVYDISTTCNLRCEGCLFFDRDGHYAGPSSPPSSGVFSHFFAEERKRGVNYPIFGGAEPALRQDILRAAAAIWDCGMVHTNATIKISPDIPFRLYVSFWGHRAATAKWRGADCYDKVLNNITGDPRAVANYTISSKNIEDIFPVVSDCAQRNIKITFQIYSPTSDYLQFLDEPNQQGHKFISRSNPSDNLVLSQDDDRKALSVVKECIDSYPDHVLFSHDLAEYIFQKPGVFWGEPCEDEVPKGCLVARDKNHRHHRSDLTIEQHKTCGHPSIDCRRCRLYTTIFTSYFGEKLTSIRNMHDLQDYMYAHSIFDKIFYEQS